MAIKKVVWFALFSSVTVVLGAFEFTCEQQRPTKGSVTSCTCKSEHIIFLKLNGFAISLCGSGNCALFVSLTDYNVTTNSANTLIEYSLYVQTFSYASCGKYSCKDSGLNEEREVDLMISDFNNNVPSAIDEPADKEGNISITTDCLFRRSDIVVKWYTVQGDIQEPYSPEKTFEDSTACSDTCSGEAAVILKIGFTHSEETSSPNQKVKFKIEVYHSAYLNNNLVLTTIKEYYIKASTPGSGPPVEIIIPSVIGGLLFGGIIIGVFLFCVNSDCNKIYCSGNPPWPVWILCIIVVGFGILIVFAIRHCCMGNGTVTPN